MTLGDILVFVLLLAACILAAPLLARFKGRDE